MEERLGRFTNLMVAVDGIDRAYDFNHEGNDPAPVAEIDTAAETNLPSTSIKRRAPASIINPNQCKKAAEHIKNDVLAVLNQHNEENKKNMGSLIAIMSNIRDIQD